MKKLSSEALDVLSCAVEITGNRLRLLGKLDRKLYVEVNEALEAIGGAWNRKTQAHLFESSPEAALDQILVDGGFHDTKRDLDQFFTPLSLAREVVKKAEVQGHIVLEPSAGSGVLADECIAQGAEQVYCVELDDKHCARLVERHERMLVFRADFLKWQQACRPKRVVMNPPFARQQDIEHVTAAFERLDRSGLLVAIMSAGTRFRKNRKADAFRALVQRAEGTIEDLPEKSFEESGTNVRTVLVTLRKH
jgi:predicted RNA methylase